MKTLPLLLALALSVVVLVVSRMDPRHSSLVRGYQLHRLVVLDDVPREDAVSLDEVCGILLLPICIGQEHWCDQHDLELVLVSWCILGSSILVLDRHLDTCTLRGCGCALVCACSCSLSIPGISSTRVQRLLPLELAGLRPCLLWGRPGGGRDALGT